MPAVDRQDRTLEALKSLLQKGRWSARSCSRYLGRDDSRSVLVVVSLTLAQELPLHPLGGDTPQVARDHAAEDLIDEAPVGLELDESRTAARRSASPIARFRYRCGLWTEPAAENHQKTKRPPMVGAKLLL